jgi:hypothetical protein
MVPVWLWILVSAQSVALATLGAWHFCGPECAKAVLETLGIMTGFSSVIVHVGQLNRPS